MTPHTPPQPMLYAVYVLCCVLIGDRDILEDDPRTLIASHVALCARF
jgi:hypothetical protein